MEALRIDGVLSGPYSMDNLCSDGTLSGMHAMDTLILFLGFKRQHIYLASHIHVVTYIKKTW
jgi:hypothetical protein